MCQKSLHLDWLDDMTLSDVRAGWVAVPFEQMASKIRGDELRFGSWQLRVSSDTPAALLEIDCDRCWKGEIAFDLDEKGRVVRALAPYDDPTGATP